MERLDKILSNLGYGTRKEIRSKTVDNYEDKSKYNIKISLNSLLRILNNHNHP